MSTVHWALRRNGSVTPLPPRKSSFDRRFEREISNDLGPRAGLEKDQTGSGTGSVLDGDGVVLTPISGRLGVEPVEALLANLADS